MKRSESGQMLLMSIGILLVLLICIPAVVFMNSSGIRHQTQSQKLAQGDAIAEAGIAYASAQLSENELVWAGALAGNFGVDPNVLTMCNSAANTTNVTGTQFRINCSHDSTQFPGLQSYEVAIVSTAWLPGPDGNPVATKTLQTYISRKTLGAFLADGTRASAALELVQVPNPPLPVNSLFVYWGSIVCLDNNLWIMSSVNNNPIDQVQAGTVFPGYPRKFSAGGIQGSSYPRSPTESVVTTDNKEYWAFASLGFPSTINEYDYLNNPTATASVPIVGALFETVIPAEPICCVEGTNCATVGTSCIQNPPNSGYFSTNTTDEVVFDGYTIAAGNPVIYVAGNARFKNMNALDFGNNGAVIVTGDLTLDTLANGVTKTLNIPLKAPQEFPYWPASAPLHWSGFTQCNPSPTTGLCTTNNPTFPAPFTNFRGFLWVKRNLIVNGAWALNGSVLVGDPTTGTGQLQMGTGNLTIYYDDKINHNILVNPR